MAWNPVIWLTHMVTVITWLGHAIVYKRRGVLTSVLATDIHQRYQNLRHLDPCMGLNLGVFGFSHNQNDCGLSSAVLPACTAVWAWRQTRVKCCAVREDRESISVEVASACVVGKNKKTPKLSPMADDAIKRGGIGCLVSLVYICGSCSNLDILL